MTFSKNIFLLGWLAVMYLLSCIVNVMQKEHVCGENEYRPTWAFAILTVVPLICFAAIRGGFADTYAYLQSYQKLPSSFGELIRYMPAVNKDPGFTFLSGLIKLVIGNHTVAYLAIIAVFQSVLLVSVYRKYSPAYITSLFLFIASTDYISWMFNGLRQFMAVTMIFAATGLILRRKWIPTILIILLASAMHQSALIMLPIVLIAQGRAWNYRTIFFILGAVLAVVFVDRFTDILDNIMRDTQYENVVNDWESWDDDGTNILRVLVYAIPSILSLIGLRYIRSEGDSLINMCVNMSVVSTGLYIVSAATSGIFIGRLPIYMSLYNYILLPWEIQHMFTRQSARIVNICMITAYFLFNVYQMKFAWGL